MTRLRVSLACTQTDRAAPILDGRIPIPGCEVIALPGRTQDIFRRVLEEQAFDIAEMSMGSHIVQVGRGVQDYLAIPVFLSRAFRHSALYVRTDRGITRPEDLAGRTLGIGQFQQTVGLWVRQILGESHGVGSGDIAWVNGGLETPGGGERIALELPAAIRLTAAAPGETLNGLLAAGRIDGLIATSPPSCFAAGTPGVGRLFADYRAAETAWFRQTGFFPIMHCLVIRRRLVEAHPWLPVEVFRAFARARDRALEDLMQMNIARVSLAWVAEEAQRTRAILGERMWSYGLAPNRAELAAMLRQALADGLIARPLTPDELFEPSTRALPDRG